MTTTSGTARVLRAPAYSPGDEGWRRLGPVFDPETLTPLPSEVPAPVSGVASASGLVRGLPTVAFTTVPSVKGGALGEAGCRQIVRAIDTAIERDAPVIGLWHSGGARLDEGVLALDGVGAVFAAMVRASGCVPQISVVLGPAAGGAAYGPALTDLVIMSAGARVFVTGPDVVRKVIGEDVDMAELGGPEPHSRMSGLADVVTADDPDAVERARDLVGLLACRRQPHVADVAAQGDPGELLPQRSRVAYDVRPLLTALLDASGLELKPRYGPSMVTMLGRLHGRTVGVLANNPIALAGCLDAPAAEKAARFVRMCDALGVPLVVVVDVPGYLPGTAQEWSGIVRRGAKLLHAFAEAVVPRVTLVTRKAYGGAYIAMNSRALGATAVLAWPTAEIGVMGPEAAVDVLHRRALAVCLPERRDALRQQLVAELQATSGGLHHAYASGVVDEVVAPRDTRHRLAQLLAAAPERRGRHANIPL